MSVFTALYNLLVGPLELFFEILFSVANRVIDNPGLSIIFLSLAMNFLVLPLYKRADAMQAEERDTELRLKPWVTHIKKTFKGDERFMILQTFYRQNNYKPTYALKGSVSLLLEVPFFIAAYNFLSKLDLLNGFKFGPISDLGAPDGLLVIGGIAINVLPILMTLINIISSAIYTKGLPAKSKITLYGMAAIFLVLLYTSPAGLVFYWTLNNLFSLVKNVFYKLKNPKLVLCILSTIASTAFLIVSIFVHPMENMRKQFFVVAFLLLFQLPLIFYFVGKKAKKKEKAPVIITKKEKTTFHAGCIFAALVVGLLIPLTIMNASPEEFINMNAFSNPLFFILNAVLLSVGTFVIWFGIFYILASDAGKRVMSLALWLFAGVGTINYLFFSKDYGNLSPMLKYDVTPEFPIKGQLINLAVCVITALILFVIWAKKEEIVRILYITASVGILATSLFNVQKIQSVVTAKKAQLDSDTSAVVSIPLSKNGKNVVVIMMDRMVGTFIPYLINEKPELKDIWAGFTYYPNTISFGGSTNVGSPALYGGYEYTPAKMNARSDTPLGTKQNEALRVMPVSFNNEGFGVTVFDPSYAGYEYIPNLSIYDDYPEIRKFNTIGKFDENAPQKEEMRLHLLNRNFFNYSLFRLAPTFVQPTIYNHGQYNESKSTEVEEFDAGVQSYDGYSKSNGLNSTFMTNYAVLHNLTQITDIQDTNENKFLMMSNNLTHEPMLLQEPNYEIATVVDNTAYDEAHKDRFVLNGRVLDIHTVDQMIHYQTNMFTMFELGHWFDYLRENDLYDNTRIIVVSDHARGMRVYEDLTVGPNYEDDLMLYNATLMVKDFNAKEFTIDDSFMTNADVPTMAMAGLIENPINPATKKPINNDAKFNETQYVTFSQNWDIGINCGNRFMPSKWASVHDNIFDINNWELLDESEVS